MSETFSRIRDLLKSPMNSDFNILIGEYIVFLKNETNRDSWYAPDDFISIVLGLLVVENRSLSPVNSYNISMCLVSYFQKQKHPNYWDFLTLMSNEIPGLFLPSIIALGVVSKKIGCHFKAQLGLLISQLSKSGNIQAIPYICQCYRRIIKGTGDFLHASMPVIFNFVKKCMATNNEFSKSEALKTAAVLFRNGKYDYNKVYQLIVSSISSDNSTIGYFAAKSLAKLLFANSNNDIFNCLKEYFAIISVDKSFNNIITSIIIAFRYFDPISIVMSLRKIVKFIVSIATLKLSNEDMLNLSKSCVKAIFNVTGSSISKAILTNYMDFINVEPINTQKRVLLLGVLTSLEISKTTSTGIFKWVLPLVECGSKEIVSLLLSYFQSLVSRDVKFAKAFFETQSSLLFQLDENNPVAIFGQVKLMAIEILMNKGHSAFALKSVDFLKSSTGVSSPKIGASFLLFSSLIRKKELDDRIYICIDQYIPSYIKDIGSSIITQSIANNIKYIALFLLSSVQSGKIPASTSKFIAFVFPHLSSFSSPSVFCIFKLIDLASLDCISSLNITKGIVNSMNRFFKLDDFDFDELTLPFSDANPQQVLYGIKNLSKGLNVYQLISGIEGRTCSAGLCREIARQFPKWIKLCPQNEREKIVSSLFKGPNPNLICGQLVLLKALLSKKAYTCFLPSDTLPQLLVINASDIRVKRLASLCVSRWIYCYPVLANGFIDHICETKKSLPYSFSVISENPMLFGLSNITKVLCFLEKEALNGLNSEISFLLYNISKIKEISNDDRLSIIKISKICVYQIPTYSSSIVYYISQTLINISAITKVYDNEIIAIGSALLDNVINSRISGYYSLELLSSLNYYTDSLKDQIDRFRVLKDSPYLFISSLFSNFSIDSIPPMFCLLQQTNHKGINSSLIKAFNSVQDIKFWTDMCKRIVLNSCVPPSERSGDIRIAPTRNVILAAMNISSLLVNLIRENFPNDLGCIDDVIAIAFTALQFKDQKIDQLSYGVVSSVLEQFGNIKNGEEKFLSIFCAQFYPMISHALLDVKRLYCIGDFLINYLVFLEGESRNEMVSLLSKQLSQLKIDSSNSMFFCRIASIIHSFNSAHFESLNDQFLTASSNLIIDIFQQKVSFSDLKNEVYDFVTTLPPGVLKRGHYLLILNSMNYKSSSSILKCFSTFIDNGLVSIDDLDYVLQVIPRNYGVLPIKHTISEDELDVSTFSIDNHHQNDVISQFLLSLLKIPELFSGMKSSSLELLLYHSISNNVCYPMLSTIIMKSDSQFIEDHSGSILLSLINENPQFSGAVFLLLFKRLTVGVADQLIPVFIEKCKSTEATLRFIRVVVCSYSDYNLASIHDISQFIAHNLYNGGIQLIASLITNERTRFASLVILSNGILDQLLSEKLLKHAPIVLRFIEICLKTKELQDNVLLEHYSLYCMDTLAKAYSNKDRIVVVSPAVQILKQIPQKILRKSFFGHENKELIIQSLSPPKQKHTQEIKLLSFSSSNARRSNERGWQTLSEDTDTVSKDI